MDARGGVVGRWDVGKRTGGCVVWAGRSQEAGADGEAVGDVSVGTGESAIATS